MVCPSVREDNPRTLALGLPPEQVDKPWYNCFILPFGGLHSVFESFAGVYTSTNSTKIKFTPLTYQKRRKYDSQIGTGKRTIATKAGLNRCTV